MPFYNCHMHVFSADCAPEHFLKIGGGWFLKNFNKPVKRVLETKPGHWLVTQLSGLRPHNKLFSNLARYGSFASVGTMSTQKMVFENILQYYPPETRFVVLTLNMDYMGAGDAILNFQGQVDQVITLRQQYPDACLPFLCIDPRMSNQAKAIEDYVKRYVGPGKPFIGIKLYPSLGFFPYDQRLELMYAYCEENKVPLMTHCDPGGSFYLGRLDAVMGCPGCISYQGYTPKSVAFSAKDNDRETELFLEPHAWDVVLAKWPRLKLCFAHMGGSDALRYKSVQQPKPDEESSMRWFLDIKELMAAYPNIYTDVSYTLHNNKNWPFMLDVLEGNNDLQAEGRWSNPQVKGGNSYQDTIKDRILFGTDYFMTEREKSEKELAGALPGWLLREDPKGPYREGGRAFYEALTEKNPEDYLRSNFYQP